MAAERLSRFRWQPMTRRERALTTLWLVIAVVLWNGLYDLTFAPYIKEYLFRAAMHEAGRGPQIPIAVVLDEGILKAGWVSTLWTCVVLLAGLLTVRLRGTS